MRIPRHPAMVRAVLPAVVAGLVLAGATAAGAAAPDPADPADGTRAACPAQPGPYARCLTSYAPQTATNRARAAGRPVAPEGWGATDIAAAYRLPVDRASTTVVAVSIAFDAPDLEQDLNVYRQQYGLPPCTAASGCFRKVNQAGNAAPLPEANYRWAIESTLDVSMISAACPACRILVVESDSNGFADLAATEDTAVRLGAAVVSNSYGARESGATMKYAAHYDHPGHMIVVSSGDSGFTAASYPAILATVVAVGGTTLSRAANPRGWSETAWPRGGSGCSAYTAKPAWQHDRNCHQRTVADVAAVAEGIAIYNTGAGGWLTVRGTSASAPLVAGVFGLAGPGPAATTGPARLYQHADALFDVTTGTNDPVGHGDKCGNDYLCVATAGYDAPTGLGTPNGIAAF